MKRLYRSCGLALLILGTSSWRSLATPPPPTGVTPTPPVLSRPVAATPAIPAPDFAEADNLEPVTAGFNAIYVSRTGDVLGTFIKVPGATIQVYADGHIAIADQDYTEIVEQDASGRILTIGRADFDYFRNGRISDIDGIDFRYLNSGRLRAIEHIDFYYQRSGRLRKIEEVRFDYDPNGLLQTMSAYQTRSGIHIVVVDALPQAPSLTN